MRFLLLSFNLELGEFTPVIDSTQYFDIELLNDLSCFIYYFDFKLINCTICKYSINSTGLKGHINKHLNGSLIEKTAKANKYAKLIETTLRLESSINSLDLIVKFQNNQFKFIKFNEFNIINIFKCEVCNTLIQSKQNIRRHYNINHKDLQLNPYKLKVKAQALEFNKKFFEIFIKDKQVIRESIISNNISPIRSSSEFSNNYEINNNFIISESSFEVLNLESNIINSDLIELNSTSNLTNELEAAKQSFLQRFNNKKDQFITSLNSFKLDPSEKLSPFQIKTRYIEYINKYNIQDLQAIVTPEINSIKELELIDLNLKEILYLSIEKSVFLNKSHLNILNSFEKNKVKNKGFKPLLNSQTRTKYFTFFSQFFNYFIRSLHLNIIKIRQEGINNFQPYFKVNKTILELYNQLFKIVKSEINKEDSLLNDSLNKLKKAKSYSNSKLNKLRIKSLLSNKIRLEDDLEEVNNEFEEEEEEVSDINSINSIISSNSSNSSNLNNSSKSNSNLSINSNFDFNSILESSNIEIINQIKEINKSKDKANIIIKDLIIKLLIEIFKQKQDLNIFDSCINTFFAASSIRKDNSFKDTLELSQMYSKFIYCSQLIIIEYSFNELIDNSQLELIDILSWFMNEFFNNSANTALAEILNNRSYAFKINKETSTNNFVSISNINKETVSYNKVTISVDELRLLFNNLIIKVNKLLKEDLLLEISSDLYKSITLENFAKYEDRSNTTPYKSFRDFHPNNINNSKFILNYIFNNTLLFNRFFKLDNSQSLIIKNQEAKRYLESILEFKKLALLLIYLTSGLPLRGTELLTLKYINSIKDKREIFLDISSNLFIINISYYKGQGLSEKRASNIRYLCNNVSKIFLLYIVLVDPFVSFLNINIFNSNQLIKTRNLIPYFFFYNKSILETRAISLTLSSLSNIVLGKKLTIQTYRQIIICIIKEFMLENLNSNTLLLEEEENSLNSLVANQSNHSLQVEDLNYARNSFTFSNINSNLQFKYLQFCLRYFRYFNLNQELDIEAYSNELRIRNNIQINNNLNISNSFAIKYSKVISSSSSNNNNNNNITSKKHKRQESSITSNSALISNKKIKLLDLVNLSNISYSSKLLRDLLRDFLQDSKAEFKSLEQELLIKSILLKIPYLLGVLPTSAGKSLSYLLTSALNTSKVTIVIIPLIGLKTDIIRRANEFNIPCNIYEKTKEFKNITLISIETIRNSNFIFAIKELINSNKLDRIIIDECHLLITALNYRNIMFKFKELLILPTQFVFLTGTLPLDYERDLISNLSLLQLNTIRGNCERINISYKAIPYINFNQEAKINQIQNYIKAFIIKEFLTTKDKILIFCASIKEVEEVALALNCAYYYSSLSLEEKTNILNNFFNNKEEYFNILVSTSGLEEGLDYSSIRLVIYKDITLSFIGFLQGSSRAGRDGLNCTSAFFYNIKDYRYLDNNSFINNNKEKSLIINYLSELICRRRQIALFLNNSIKESCSNSEALCDLCFNRNQVVSNQISIIESSNSEIEASRIIVNTNLKLAFNICIYCSVLKEVEEVDLKEHTCKECLLFILIEELAFKIKIKIRNKEFYLNSDSCCFICLLPTVICYSLKEDNNRCLNSKFIFRILALFYIKYIKLNIYKDYKEEFNSLDSFLKYSLEKEYIKEINTEGIRVFNYFVYNS